MVRRLLGSIAANSSKPLQARVDRALFGAAAASYVESVHGEELKLGAAKEPAIGYVPIAFVCAFYAYRAKHATPLD